eukprot:5090821-Pleurochrysis_carterae.AAC.1
MREIQRDLDVEIHEDEGRGESDGEDLEAEAEAEYPPSLLARLVRSGSASGYYGVYSSGTKSKYNWEGHLKLCGEKDKLGVFKTKVSAAVAVLRALEQ